MSKFVLLRTMEKQYLEFLLNSGEMLFKPSKYFRELEMHDPRMDQNDNKPKNIEIIKNGEVVRIGGALHSGVGLQIGGLDNIYCFTAVKSDNLERFIAENTIGKFGGEVLVISDPGQFLAQAKSVVNTLNGDYINYVPQYQIDGKEVIGPFEKSERYSDEFEYRLAYFHGRGNELIAIGSIAKYSKIIPMSGLEALLRNEFSTANVS